MELYQGVSDEFGGILIPLCGTEDFGDQKPVNQPAIRTIHTAKKQSPWCITPLDLCPNVNEIILGAKSLIGINTHSTSSFPLSSTTTSPSWIVSFSEYLCFSFSLVSFHGLSFRLFLLFFSWPVDPPIASCVPPSYGLLFRLFLCSCVFVSVVLPIPSPILSDLACSFACSLCRLPLISACRSAYLSFHSLCFGLSYRLFFLSFLSPSACPFTYPSPPSLPCYSVCQFPLLWVFWGSVLFFPRLLDFTTGVEIILFSGCMRGVKIIFCIYIGSCCQIQTTPAASFSLIQYLRNQ